MEDPPLLWLFVPLRYQTEHTCCSLRRKCSLSPSCSFKRCPEGRTHQHHSEISLQQRLPQTASLSYKLHVSQLRCETGIKRLAHLKSFLAPVRKTLLHFPVSVFPFLPSVRKRTCSQDVRKEPGQMQLLGFGYGNDATAAKQRRENCSGCFSQAAEQLPPRGLCPW